MFRCPHVHAHRLLALALFIVLPLVSTAEDVLDEIIVRADFRERAAADLPPSITVLDRSTIEQSAVQHFEELVFSVPNLNYSGDGHRARYFQIRGIGELEQYEGAPNPSVGFLIDDIDFSGIATVATLFDIEQVDVLRGPQGTRYGANALAGLIYVQSVAPTTEWGGRVQLTAGNDDALAGGFAFGGPLIEDELGFRVAAHYHESNGFRDNAFLKREDTNGRKETMVRGRLDWQANDTWQLRLTAMGADIDDGYDAFAVDNSLTMQSDRPGRDAQQSHAASLRATRRGSERFAFTSITAYADSDITFSFDADWGNESVWAPYTYDFISLSKRQRRTLSQELRISSEEQGRLFGDSTSWLAGVYVLRLNDDLTTINQGDYVDPFFNFSLAIDDQFGSDFEALTTAVFGELDIDIGERGVLTFGLRGERRTTDYTDTAALTLDPAESMFGGEIRYRHELKGNILAFATLSRGYKAGGFNLGVVPADRREFSREALWNAEAGVRSTWLDGDLAVNGLLFANRRRDQQVRTSFQLVPNDPASFVFFTDNAASGKSLGLEAEVMYRASDALKLYFNAGLLRAEFAEFRTPQVDLSGRDQAHAPRYTLAAGVEWRLPSGYFARFDVQARDDFYFDVSHDQKSQPYELVNARVGYDAESWQLQLWARNLLDENYAVRGFYFGNEPPDFPATLYTRQGDPRHIGLTFDMRF